jgi:hypothetical protein
MESNPCETGTGLAGPWALANMPTPDPEAGTDVKVTPGLEVDSIAPAE